MPFIYIVRNNVELTRVRFEQCHESDSYIFCRSMHMLPHDFAGANASGRHWSLLVYIFIVSVIAVNVNYSMTTITTTVSMISYIVFEKQHPTELFWSWVALWKKVKWVKKPFGSRCPELNRGSFDYKSNALTTAPQRLLVPSRWHQIFYMYFCA